jgi:serine/threonine protein kinase
VATALGVRSLDPRGRTPNLTSSPGTAGAIGLGVADRSVRATDTEGLLLGSLRAGDRVGEYIVEAQVAGRGTGLAYEAIHVVLPRRVTIKVRPAHQWAKSVAHDLLREACIIDALDHPGIPRLYECGMLPDHQPWTATELVAGTSVQMAIERDVSAAHAAHAANVAHAATIDAPVAAAIVRDVAEILDYAHGRGLVHNHVTTESIILPSTPRRFPLCLVDWSGARAYDSTTPLPLLPGLTARPFASPELRHGDATDGRSDIYSLGIIARELLRRGAVDAPPVFAALVHRMLAADPTRRPSAYEVRDHAAWLAEQIDVDIDVDVDEVVDSPSGRLITSESTPNVSGEIGSR